MRLTTVDWVAYVLVIVGGINWGLVGFFNFNLITALFGEDSALSRIVFVLVGLSAVYLLATVSKMANRSDNRAAV